MQIVPLTDTPSQTVQVTLGNQSCTISVYQKRTGLFLDVSVNGVLLIGGVICQNLNFIVRDAYIGFIGDLIFQDTQGSSDPTTPGLGSRYLLCYDEA